MIAGLVIGFLVGVLVAAAVVVARRQSRLVADGAELAERDRAVHAAESQVARLQAELDSERRRREPRGRWRGTRRASALKGEFATHLRRRHCARTTSSSCSSPEEVSSSRSRRPKATSIKRTQSIEQLLSPASRAARPLRSRRCSHLESDRQQRLRGTRPAGEATQRVPRTGSSHETRNLVTALRAPATRGRWGSCSCGA